jgi:hypothetical protein
MIMIALCDNLGLLLSDYASVIVFTADAPVPGTESLA